MTDQPTATVARWQRLVVIALDRGCELIDRLPNWTWRIPGLHRLGCPSGMAIWSEALDRRWDVGEWSGGDCD